MGHSTILECTIEAYPRAVNYWERHDGKTIQTLRDKYAIGFKEYGQYKIVMTLNVSLSEVNDFGTYFCISKNEKGLTKAGVTVFGKVPHQIPSKAVVYPCCLSPS